MFDSQEMSREQGQRDFLEQQRWAEIRDTIAACVEAGVIPIINENDTTNTDGMRFGDNDNLAALTAVQLGAAGVFLFTDVDYLYTAGAQAVPLSRHATQRLIFKKVRKLVIRMRPRPRRTPMWTLRRNPCGWSARQWDIFFPCLQANSQQT